MNELMSKIVACLFKGKVSGFLIFYIIVGSFEIVCAVNTNTGGELNGYGWIAGILGLVVAAPWYWIPMALISFGGPNLESHLTLIIIPSVIINSWLIYKIPYWDASTKKQNK